jgi:DNA-binding NarL/FixJ family response regulator
MVTILLADDHGVVRAGMRALLGELGMQVVAETGDGQQALQLIGEKKPDLALLDISMPGLNGLEVAERARKQFPGTRIVMLSMHADDEFARRALASGALGYVLKNADRAELEAALRSVLRGDVWLSPSVSRRFAEAGARPRPPGEAPFEVLTPRQREVLQLIAEGLSTKEIAAKLNLGVKTVETHRAELMQRLGIHGVAGLVRYAIRMGIVQSSS